MEINTPMLTAPITSRTSYRGSSRAPGSGFTRKTHAVVAHTYGYDFAAAFAHDLSSHIGRVPQCRRGDGRADIECANAG